MILRKARILLLLFFCIELYGILVQVLTERTHLYLKGYPYQLLTFRVTNGSLRFLIFLVVSEVLFLCMHHILKDRFSVWVVVALFITILLMPIFQAYISPTKICLLCSFYGSAIRSDPSSASADSGRRSVHVACLVLSQINQVDIFYYQDGIIGVFHLTALTSFYMVRGSANCCRFCFFGITVK